MSLSNQYHHPRNFLDIGVNNDAINRPMAASDFGAETGSFFLKSTPPAKSAAQCNAPSNYMQHYTEYAVEPCPRTELKDAKQEEATSKDAILKEATSKDAKVKEATSKDAKVKEKVKLKDAAKTKRHYHSNNTLNCVDNTSQGALALRIPNSKEVCQKLSWDTFPGCIVESVIGIFQDLRSKSATTNKNTTTTTTTDSENNESYWTIFTKSSRPVYLGILLFLLYLLYRIIT